MTCCTHSVSSTRYSALRLAWCCFWMFKAHCSEWCTRSARCVHFSTGDNFIVWSLYSCIVRYPLLLNHAVWFFLYLPHISPRTSDWKSQGETRTMSPKRIQTLLFIFPRIRQRRSWPSWHLTIIRSKPSNLMAIPNTSLAAGTGILPMSSSLTIFLLPKRIMLLLSSCC